MVRSYYGAPPVPLQLMHHFQATLRVDSCCAHGQWHAQHRMEGKLVCVSSGDASLSTHRMDASIELVQTKDLVDVSNDQKLEASIAWLAEAASYHALSHSIEHCLTCGMI